MDGQGESPITYPVPGSGTSLPECPVTLPVMNGTVSLPAYGLMPARVV